MYPRLYFSSDIHEDVHPFIASRISLSIYIFIILIHSPTIYFKHIMCVMSFAYIDMYHFTYQNSPQVYIKCNVRIRMHEEIIEMKKKNK